MENGELRAAAGAGPELVYAESWSSPGSARGHVFQRSTSRQCVDLIVNVREAGVGADAFIGHEIAGPRCPTSSRWPAPPQLELIRDLPCAVPTNRWVRLAIQRLGPSIGISVDGKQITAFNDREHPLTGGSVGLRVWQRTARFRDLLLTNNGKSQRVAFEGSGPTVANTFPSADLPPIAFIVRHPLSRPNTISCDIWQSQPAKPGCRIDIIDPGRPASPPKTVFSDPKGCIYDMNVSYDAERCSSRAAKRRSALAHLAHRHRRLRAAPN